MFDMEELGHFWFANVAPNFYDVAFILGKQNGYKKLQH